MVQFFRLKKLVNLGALKKSRRKSEWNRLSVYLDLLIGIETPGRTDQNKTYVLMGCCEAARSIGI